MALQKGVKEGIITVVDHHPESLKPVRAIGCQTTTMDAITFLRANQIKPDDWIVPAIPLHVAFGWLRAVIKSDSQFKEITVPGSIGSQIPNPVWGDNGRVYTSIATFRCPDDCPEPNNICTITQKPRPQRLWKTLANLHLPGFKSVCIVSHQMAPGVGGYQYKALQQSRQVIQGDSGKFLLSTACKCHGVINAFTITK